MPKPIQAFDRYPGRIGLASSWGAGASLGLSIALLLGMGLKSAQAQGAAQPTGQRRTPQSLLAQERWESSIHGLSLRPPKGVKQVEQTSNGSLVSFVAGSDYRMSVSVHYPKGEVDLKTVKDAARKQFGFAYPAAKELTRVSIDHSRRRRTASLFLAAEDKRGEEFIWGQFYLMMRPSKLAVIEVRTDRARFDQVRKLLGQVIDSIKIESTKKLQERRKTQLKAGQDWLDSISTKQIKKALSGPARFFRIVENGKDVGYMRVRTIVDDAALKADDLAPGYTIKTNSRIVADKRVYDSSSSFYVSDDGESEIWSQRTTLRKKVALSGAKTSTWTETGVRSNGRQGDRITVTRAEPAKYGTSQSAAQTSKQTDHWPVPTIAYLSQADLYALRSFYAGLGDQTLSFYAYDAKSKTLTLRCVWAKALQGGGHAVTIRPTPSSGKRTYVYDAQGKLIQRRMADGRIFIRTTPSKLERIWTKRR